MKVSARIQIKGVWLERGYHSVHAGKVKPTADKCRGLQRSFPMLVVPQPARAENNQTITTSKTRVRTLLNMENECALTLGARRVSNKAGIASTMAKRSRLR